MNVDGNTQILKNERLLLLYRRVATCKVVVEPTEGRCCAEVRFVVVFLASQPPIQILSSVCRY
jgi:hypothetical protein